MTEKGYKHSSHLVYPEVIFTQNNGAMKRLAEAVARAHALCHGVLAVDCAVHTRDRAFRAQLCYKLADASRTAMTWDSEPADLRASMLAALVSNVPPGSQFVEEKAVEEKAVGQKPVDWKAAAGKPVDPTRGRRACEGAGHRGVCGGIMKSYPAEHVERVREQLQKFLSRKGGLGTVARSG
eukprot:302072-Rhodomonas_salina.1